MIECDDSQHDMRLSERAMTLSEAANICQLVTLKESFKPHTLKRATYRGLPTPATDERPTSPKSRNTSREMWPQLGPRCVASGSNMFGNLKLKWPGKTEGVGVAWKSGRGMRVEWSCHSCWTSFKVVMRYLFFFTLIRNKNQRETICFRAFTYRNPTPHQNFESIFCQKITLH